VDTKKRGRTGGRKTESGEKQQGRKKEKMDRGGNEERGRSETNNNKKTQEKNPYLLPLFRPPSPSTIVFVFQ
jgi:hypothetical protein